MFDAGHKDEALRVLCVQAVNEMKWPKKEQEMAKKKEQAVFAPADGKVTMVGYGIAWGHYCEIIADAPAGQVPQPFLYRHLARRPVVREGQRIIKGALVGYAQDEEQGDGSIIRS